jgi:hypothetical protein
LIAVEDQCRTYLFLYDRENLNKKIPTKNHNAARFSFPRRKAHKGDRGMEPLGKLVRLIILLSGIRGSNNPAIIRRGPASPAPGAA